MEKSFTDMVIARGWTQQQRDATSVTRDKVFEFQLNIGRIGIMKAICHKAAGMRWWPQETPVMANRSLAPCLREDWRLCVAPVLLCWVKAAPGILWSIPPSTTSLNAFQMKAAVVLVQSHDEQERKLRLLRPQRTCICSCFYTVCHSHQEDPSTIW